MDKFVVDDVEVSSVCIAKNNSKFLVVSKTTINELIRIMWLDLYDSKIHTWDYEQNQRLLWCEDVVNC